MKLVLRSLVLLSVIFGGHEVRSAGLVEVVSQPLTRAFIPKGFDDNDSVQIVVTGKFEGSCLQLGHVVTEVDQKNKEIFLDLRAHRFEGTCLQGGMTFQATAYLGRLSQPGEFQVIDRTSRTRLGTLHIGEAPEGGPGTDSESYAPLTDAFLTTENESQFLTLRGLRAGYCGGMTDVSFDVQGDVLVVLPKFRVTQANCPHEPTSFEAKVKVPKLPETPFLLHVRSMGGQSFNKMNY